METETGSQAKSALSKVALPAAVAAAGAGLGLLFMRAPRRLRESMPELPQGARDVIGDLKQRFESFGDAQGIPEPSGNGSTRNTDEFEARRRERKERRERRRKQATT